MKTRTNDATALLPFPEPPAYPRRPRVASRVGVRRATPLQLAGLDLRSLQAGTRRPDPVRTSPWDTVPRSGAEVEAEPEDARAVRPGGRCGFYLDLLGAVAVMALVLLAAILV